MKKLVMSIIVFCIALLQCSCRNTNENNFVRIPGNNGYSQIVCLLDAYENYDSQITNVFRDDDHYYISELLFKIEDDCCLTKTAIFQFDNSGNKINEIEIDGDFSPSCMVDSNMVYLSPSNQIVIFNPLDGNVINEITTFVGKQVFQVESVGGYIFVLEENQITQLNSTGEVLSCVMNDDWRSYPYSQSVLLQNGKHYVVSIVDNYYVYYSVDFETGKSYSVCDSRMFASYCEQCSGSFMFNNLGEYYIDIENQSLVELADFDEINMKPASKSLLQQPIFAAIDELNFCKIYQYSDSSSEILLYKYDSTIDYSDAKRIVIGGYGVSSDLSILWCQYLYNINHDEYRVVLDDYADEFFFDSSEQGEIQFARLLQYFSEGNAPDIFYGDEFDYNYLGVNSMLVDYNELWDDELNLNSFPDSMQELIVNRDGNCYQLFSAYTMSGFWGLTRNFDDGNVALDCLADISDSVCWGNIPASEIVYFALGYNLYDLNCEDQLTVENITNVLENAYSLGTPGNVTMSYNDLHSVEVGDYLLSLGNLGDFASYCSSTLYVREGVTFAGYPSIDGSVRLVTPVGSVGISSSSENINEAWDVVKYMFTDEVQQILAVNQSIPIRLDVLVDYINCIYTHDSIDSENNILMSGVDLFYRILPSNIELSETDADNYIQAVCSANTIATHDWGIYNIIVNEVEAYYLEDKPIEIIANNLYERLSLYLEENY